jgi:hypothetical protein
VPGRRVRLLYGLLHGAREQLLHGFEVCAVRGDAMPLHAGEQRRGRQLHVAQQIGRADLLQPVPEGFAQVEYGAGLHHQRLRLGGLVGAEGELPVGRGGGRQLPAEVFQGQRVQVEGAASGLDEVGGERGVHGDAGDAPAVLGEDAHGALGVVEHLGLLRVGEPLRERVLVGLVQLRRVEPGGCSCRRGERDLGHRARTERPGVDRGDTEDRLAVLGEPRLQLARTEHRTVQCHTLGDHR